MTHNGSNWTISSADAKAVGVPRRKLCPIPDGRLRRGWLACIRRNPPICRRVDRTLEGEDPAALPVQAPAPEPVWVGRFGYCVRNI